jgi:hypothetical protein
MPTARMVGLEQLKAEMARKSKRAELNEQIEA